MPSDTGESLRDIVNVEPHQYYAQVRARGTVSWDAEVESWLVAGFDAVKQVYFDERTFRKTTPFDASGERYIGILGRKHMSSLPPDERTAVRRWWLRVFSPKAAERWRTEHVVPIVEAILDRISADARADLFEDYCKPIPMRAIAAVLDLPFRDDGWIEKYRLLMEEVQVFIDTVNFRFDEAVADRALAATAEMNRMLAPFIEARRDGSGEDPISLLWRDGPQMVNGWNDNDVYDAVRVMFFAGSDTTKLTMSNALQVLLHHPTVTERLVADPAKVGTFIEEVVRLDGANQFVTRIATEDVGVGPAEILAGDRVTPLNAAANRDAEHYGCPMDLDLGRKAPRDHLGFGAGPGICLGASLARVTLQEAIRCLLHRYPQVALDPEAEPPSSLGFKLKFHAPLNVVLEPTGTR